ncbi:MAG TPA: cytochrome P450 [Mycobacteriales bacterium]|nr:cytochrome P450 [Mycobacteriales bacterium]
MSDPDAVDFFRDNSLIADPYPYYAQLRERCPVHREPHHDVVMVTGYDEAAQVFSDSDTFSSATSVTGPFPGFPVPLEGEDVSALIEAHRDELPMADQIITMDPPEHTNNRALLMRLLTPARLRENELAMEHLADRQIEEFIDSGSCEFMRDFAGPFTMFVIADLLGVPEEDHPRFRRALRREGSAPIGGTEDEALEQNPLEFLYEAFSDYIAERRTNPRNDVLTGLAAATYPDGSIPTPGDVARLASNIFAAGQETTARLLSSSMMIIAERREVQQALRADPGKLTAFVEESLRYESPIKGDFRLSKVGTSVGGVPIPAGTTVMVVNGAANRDPRKFDSPEEFRLDRANARQHLAFGRGVHTCPGGPLARAEGRIGIERLLARTSDIRISEEHHGPADARRYSYAPTYILRGLNSLHLEFTL